MTDPQTSITELDFVVMDLDYDQAAEACRKMVAANGEQGWDSGAVGEALGLATEAFPGLQNFVRELADNDMNHSAARVLMLAGDTDPVSMAARNLALIGSKAEIDQGFDWQAVQDAVPACLAAVHHLDAQPSLLRPR